MRRALSGLAGATVLAFLASGCAVLERGPWAEGDDSATSAPADTAPPASASAVAGDLLDTFMQLDAPASGGPAFAFSREALAEDEFLAALESLMREEGYAVRIVDGVAEEAFVTHEAEPDAEEAAVVHTLSFGEVQVRRRYVRRAPDDWVPAGSVFVRGVEPDGVRPAEPRRPDPPPDERLVGADEPAGAATPVEPRASGAEGASAPSGRSVPSAPLAIDSLSGKPVYSGLVSGARSVPATAQNVFELGDSNYTGLFESYANVDELVLMFPNDSLVLGEDNKNLIRSSLERFDPERDVFSIVGCSLGPTRIDNGNEVLALGRAHRVKEELLFAGVPAERIVHEGCWAGESVNKFPSRGVVLTHKREFG